MYKKVYFYIQKLDFLTQLFDKSYGWSIIKEIQCKSTFYNFCIIFYLHNTFQKIKEFSIQLNLY